MTKLGVLTILAAACVPAFANNTAIPSTLANRTDYIVFNGNSFPSSNLICPPGADGCGGGFQAAISTTNGAPVTAATVWCVDYQLNVGTDSQYYTDIKTLNQITAPTDANVRYGNLDAVETMVGGNKTTGWANALSGSGTASWLAAAPGTLDNTSDSNSAAFRYTLTAALVSQYVDTSNQPDPTNLAGSSARNLAIQEAIWFMTYNDDYNNANWAPFSLPAADKTSTTNYAYWVNWALTTGGSAVQTSQWAVISGPADATTGNLLSPSNNSYQTFLVQVVPEPRYYVLLSVGFGLAVFIARLRRQQVQA